MIVVDGNDGLGKSTLVAELRALGYQVKDRGLPTKATDDGVPGALPPDEIYVILDAPIEISRARLKKAGKDLNEKWHLLDTLRYYRERFREVARQMHVPLIDASASPEDVLMAVLRSLRIEPRRWRLGYGDRWFANWTYRTREEAMQAAALLPIDPVDGPLRPHVLSTMRIGVPKGRLQDEVLRTMTAVLTQQRPLFGGRQYWDLQDNVEFVLVKPRSIPQMLAYGMLDAGFCGLDVVKDSIYDDLRSVVDLGTNRVQLVVAAADPNILKNQPRRPVTIATEFPRIAHEWATAHKLAHICVLTHGSTEAMVPRICDLAIDVVETGETMRANGLTILDEILSSTTRLFVRGDSAATHHEMVRILRDTMNARSGAESMRQP